ncbi:MAG: hypothetical protein JWR65_2195 [Massilia sp.]|nr:hypothetical protein [Massilia sp.]
MKRIHCLPLLLPPLFASLLASSCGAHAQSLDADDRGAYLSAQFGNGRISGGNAGDYRLMRWRTGELRVGRDMNPALVGEDSVVNPPSTARIDFIYYNEGHPDNNHRDGFALQATYSRRIMGGLSAELSAGPYSSMNTTTIDGVQINAASRGMLYSAALLYSLGHWAPGAHLRLGFNHVWMRDTHTSNAVMLGIGRHFTGVPPFADTDVLRRRLWLAASYGTSQTNQAQRQAARSGTFEAKQYGGKWAMSLKAVSEGDDQVMVDRRGVAAQLWLVQPITAAWQVCAGAGPYVAQNRRDNNSTGVHGLITMQFERNVGERSKAFFAFSRIKSFQQANDRDVFHVGVTRAFGA